MPRLLCVEDDDLTRDILLRIATRIGFDVTGVDNAEQALESCAAHDFGVALIDWGLPGMSGLELVRRIRALPRGRDIVLIIVTARDSPDDLAAILQAGADDYLPKPFELPALQRRLTIADRTARERHRRALAEKALRERDSQLNALQRFEALGRLAGGIAHDFHNVLQVVLGYADLLHGSLGEPDRLDEVNEIKLAAERALRLTRQLLAFSRDQEAAVASISIDDAIDELSSMLERLTDDSVHLRVEHRLPAPTMHVAPSHIEQVVMNLVINAGFAMPAGGEITLSTRAVTLRGQNADLLGVAAGQYVHLSVSDTGIGMDEETRRRVFEPFFTTRESGDGTGLGLSIVFRIVTQYKGGIRVDSTPGEGTTFDIYLPSVTSEAETAAAPAPTPESDAATETVLLAEDEPAVRALTSRALRRAGYTVVEAADGLDALERFAEDPPDLVVTDIRMPRMGGRELASRLRADGYEGGILFVSGFADHPLEQLPNEFTHSDFLPKPFAPGDLLIRLRALV